jgi:biopolymer transport protein ExbD
MRFYVRKRRQPPAIIIVALIDILIVLLIFLMVTTTFKQQPALKLALPESSQAQKTGAQESPPLIISIDPTGNLRLGADARPVTVDRLKAELYAAAAKNPNLQLAISADTSSPVGQLVRVIDVTKELKLRPVNLFTKPTGK